MEHHGLVDGHEQQDPAERERRAAARCAGVQQLREHQRRETGGAEQARVQEGREGVLEVEIKQALRVAQRV
ncbi:hypothetical protein LRS13_15265 [Svornostia abyssi]|uniref:Uncharacterized protein n=1 Tax=Svornostia abyssi TaxID=2898438 RepID=A0ABY5PBT6_9ACTN|nr:hypothetical protein LRS13_15265 [Parviterribacteraceae bacterium J379]